MRRDARNNKGSMHTTFTSARNLLALLRLSTALVRMCVCVCVCVCVWVCGSVGLWVALLRLSTALVRMGVWVCVSEWMDDNRYIQRHMYMYMWIDG